MLFALICKDNEGGLDIRKVNRQDHLAYLESVKDSLRYAGPLVGDEGTPIGSLIVIEVEDKAAAAAFAANDPYAKAEVFKSVEIVETRQVY